MNLNLEHVRKVIDESGAPPSAVDKALKSLSRKP
jgi:hypothetical protein